MNITGKYTNARIFAASLEESCINQIQSMCDHPAFTESIAIMPDAHAGKGSVIGFTMPLGKTLVPSVVGVDIGCGMRAMRVPQWNQEAYRDRLIRENVPMGFDTRDKPIALRQDFQEFFPGINRALTAFGRRLEVDSSPMLVNDDVIEDLFQKYGGQRAWSSIGTLGGGNHFIEVDFCPQSQEYWLIIHTGSRNFGKQICEFWERTATALSEKKSSHDERQKILAAATRGDFPKSELEQRLLSLKKKDIKIPPAWLEGKEALGYLRDMLVAQAFAVLNRRSIGQTISKLMGFPQDVTFETVHNYISPEDFVIRKGAVAAHAGRRVLIPMNMADGSFIAIGLGNPIWNNSAPHGAGRIMSRMQAQKQLTVAEYQTRMKGIFSSAEPQLVMDEAPGAYKPTITIEQAIDGQAVKITHRLSPIHNIKATLPLSQRPWHGNDTSDSLDILPLKSGDSYGQRLK